MMQIILEDKDNIENLTRVHEECKEANKAVFVSQDSFVNVKFRIDDEVLANQFWCDIIGGLMHNKNGLREMTGVAVTEFGIEDSSITRIREFLKNTLNELDYVEEQNNLYRR